MSTGEAVIAAPAPEAPLEEPGFWTRWSDRINPILVREMQQAMKGRAFVLTVFAALAVSIVIAAIVAGNREAGRRAGADAFDAGLATLVPMVLFVVPMQAYQSMRLELRAGIVEQLFLSGLRPRSILLGKLMAAMVQFALYVSVMSPLLATSYLLRGVDVPTIVVSLVWALVFCIAATAFAISAAAQAILPAMQAFANLGAALVLGIGTFSLVAFVGSGEYSRELPSLLNSTAFGIVMSLVVGGGFCSTALSLLTAQSFLLHSFENRSTGFRVFMFAMIPVAYGWTWIFVPATHWYGAVPAATFFLCLLGVVFGIFMTTEQRALSPRVFAHVPRHAGLAAIAAPLLPGRDRGMSCLILYFALVGLLALCWWPSVAPAFPGWTYREDMLRLLLFTAAYALVYLGLAKALRARLPASIAGNHVARVLVVVMVFGFCLLPVLIDAFTRGRVDWHWGHAMNPFWTIERHAFRTRDQSPNAVPIALTALCAAAALQLPAMLRGFVEVLGASSARRRRQAGTAVQSAST